MSDLGDCIAPILLSLVATGALAEGPFRDVANEVGIEFVHYNGEVGGFHMCEPVGSGVALFDYDLDGDLDVFLIQGNRLDGSPPALRDRLFRNELVGGELRFVDVTEQSLIDSRGYGMGAATGDYDRDGLLDLYVTRMGNNSLYRNRGDGTFEDVTDKAGVDDQRWGISATFFDLDRDGRLDLFVTNYVDFTLASSKTCSNHLGEPDYCGPAAYRPEPDRLFRNRGDGTFAQVSLGPESYGPGLGVVAADFDADGWEDLYVANDQMPNVMWMNREGKLMDEALLSGTAVNVDGMAEAGMGVACGDPDADGDEDLLIGHLDKETNTLYENLGGGLFSDETRGAKLGAPSFKWTTFGIVWIDYDNDSLLDVAVANGSVMKLDELILKGDPFPLHQPNQLYHNAGDGIFEDASIGEVFELSEVSRGLAVGDLDHDGLEDLVQTNNNGPVRVLMNQTANPNRWLGVQTMPLGTEATVVTKSGQRLMKRVRTGGSYISARDHRLIFGLGEDSATRLELSYPYPDQQPRTLMDPRLGLKYILMEPASE